MASIISTDDYFCELQGANLHMQILPGVGSLCACILVHVCVCVLYTHQSYIWEQTANEPISLALP